MALREIGKYKDKLFSAIMQCEDIAELILGKDYDSENVNELLIGKHIFPYLYADRTPTEPKSYICVEVDIPRTIHSAYKEMKVIIWCYCHKDIMQYSKDGYSGSRADILSDMTNRLLNNSNDFGLGTLKLQSCTNIVPYKKNRRYYGKELIYSCPEFDLHKKR